jgi:hypothetical protein
MIVVDHVEVASAVHFVNDVAGQFGAVMGGDSAVDANYRCQDLRHNTDVMRNEDDGHALVKLLQELIEFVLRRCVDIRGRLVHQQQLGVSGYSPRDKDTLPLAAGQIGKRAMLGAVKSDIPKSGGGGGTIFFRVFVRACPSARRPSHPPENAYRNVRVAARRRSVRGPAQVLVRKPGHRPCRDARDRG